MKESGLLFKASLPVSSFWPIEWGRCDGNGIFIRQERFFSRDNPTVSRAFAPDQAGKKVSSYLRVPCFLGVQC